MQHPWSMEKQVEIFRREFIAAMNLQQPQRPPPIIHAQQTTPKKHKRVRIAFSTEQVNYLEMEFKKYPYIGNHYRKEVANILNLPERAIKIWFQNRRMREKREQGSYPEIEIFRIHSTDNKDANGLPSHSMPTIDISPYSPSKSTATPSETHVAHIDLTRFAPTKKPESSRHNFYSDKIPHLPEISISAIPKAQPTRPYTSRSSDSKYQSSAEFSIDLYKKYKGIGVSDVQYKTENISLQSPPVTPPSETLQNSSYTIDYQSFPEDLSVSKESKVSRMQTSSATNVDRVGIPLYMNCHQPHFSAGNMLWKPSMPSGLPRVNVPHSQPDPLPRFLEQSTVRKKCNCVCHKDTQTGPAPPTAGPAPGGSNPRATITALPFQNDPKY